MRWRGSQDGKLEEGMSENEREGREILGQSGNNEGARAVRWRDILKTLKPGSLWALLHW